MVLFMVFSYPHLLDDRKVKNPQSKLRCWRYTGHQRLRSPTFINWYVHRSSMTKIFNTYLGFPPFINRSNRVRNHIRCRCGALCLILHTLSGFRTPCLAIIHMSSDPCTRVVHNMCTTVNIWGGTHECVYTPAQHIHNCYAESFLYSHHTIIRPPLHANQKKWAYIHIF